MYKKLRAFFLIAGAGALIFAMPPLKVATADDEDGFTGGGGVGETYTMTPADLAKQKMLDAWFAEVEAGNAEKASKITRSYYSKTGADPVLTPQAGTRPLPDPTLYPFVHSVPGVKWVQQSKDYYCGPAAGLMILRASYNKPSRYDGSSPSQTALANNNHMQTDRYGVTAWARGQFGRGLNRWSGVSNWYVQLNKPSITQTRAGLIQATYMERKPLAANTVEMKGGNHYNNHPRNSTIGHWIIAYAYSSPNGLASYATWVDPIAGFSAQWANSKTAFNEYIVNMNQFLNHSGANGIAY